MTLITFLLFSILNFSNADQVFSHYGVSCNRFIYESQISPYRLELFLTKSQIVEEKKSLFLKINFLFHEATCEKKNGGYVFDSYQASSHEFVIRRVPLENQKALEKPIFSAIKETGNIGKNPVQTLLEFKIQLENLLTESELNDLKEGRSVSIRLFVIPRSYSSLSYSGWYSYDFEIKSEDKTIKVSFKK